MKRKKYLIGIGIVLVLILLIGFFQFRSSDETKSAPFSKAKVSETNADEKREVKPTKEQDIIETNKASEKKEKQDEKEEKQPEQVAPDKAQQKPTKVMKDIETVRHTKGTLLRTKGKVTKQTDYYSLNGEKQGTLKKGETIEMSVKQKDWYIIHYKKEMYYISIDAVSPILGSEPTARKFKAKENLKVYQVADPQSKSVGEIALGKVVTVVGADNNLYQIVFKDGYGYIDRSKVSPQLN